MRATPALSGFWFFYFAGLGIFFPFFGLYLRENAGLGGTEIGIVLAVVPLVGTVAQVTWGYLADRSGARTRVLAVVTAGAALGYATLGWASDFAQMLIATAALAVFAGSVVPMAVSVSLAALRGAGPHAFGFVRAWGTLGYLCLVVGFPWSLNRLQRARGWVSAGGVSEPGLEMMFGATAVLVLMAAIVATVLPRGEAVAWRAERGAARELLRHGAVVRLCLFNFLAYAFLQGPMGIFPIYVRARGGTMDTVGTMWVVMLLLEIPLVLLSGAGLARLGARRLLAVGVLASGVRWIVCGVVTDLRIIYPVQILHGVTVAGLLIGAPLYLDAVAPERLRSTAQTLLATVGVGWGGTASNAGAGWLLEHVGVDAPYLVGGVGAVLLGCLVTRILPPVTPPAGGDDARAGGVAQGGASETLAGFP